MTHTHHRRGCPESLGKDFVVLFMLDVESDAQKSYWGPMDERVKKLLEILGKYYPIALIAGRGDERLRYMKGWSSEMDSGIHRSSRYEDVVSCKELVDEGAGHAVYTSRKAIEGLLGDLREADLGFSVVVSGIFEETFKACRAAGMEPHTVNMSLGTWGRTELLPDRKVLELCTMCGHAIISPTLVEDTINEVKRDAMTIDDATVELGKQCTCNIFNTERAKELIQKLSS
jgi:hypothetical protein